MIVSLGQSVEKCIVVVVYRRGAASVQLWIDTGKQGTEGHSRQRIKTTQQQRWHRFEK